MASTQAELLSPFQSGLNSTMVPNPALQPTVTGIRLRPQLSFHVEAVEKVRG